MKKSIPAFMTITCQSVTHVIRKLPIALHRTCTQDAHNQPLSFANVSPSQSYITYYWTPSNEDVNMETLLPLTLFESRTTIERGTTGLRTWKASFILADYLLNNPGKHFPFRPSKTTLGQLIYLHKNSFRARPFSNSAQVSDSWAQ